MVLPSPNDRQQQQYAELLQLACQGHERAIAILMNRHLKHRQMSARVAWEGTCLHILIEAAQLLQPEPLASMVYKTVLRIQVKTLQSLKVSFRRSGERRFAWTQQRAIAQDLQSQTTPSQIAPSQTTPSQTAPSQRAASDSTDRAQPLAAHSTPTDLLSLADWLNQKTQAALFEQLHPLAKADKEAELRFLRFSFSLAETALLPLMSIRQVVKVHQLLPIPDMPASVVGIHNFRGEMLWVVDLGLQIGFQSVTAGGDRSQRTPQPARQFSAPSRQLSGRMAIVIQAQGKSLGLLVPDVIDIESHNPKQLQPPAIDLFPPSLLPFIQGYLIRSSSPVLDASALIHDRRLQVHAV